MERRKDEEMEGGEGGADGGGGRKRVAYMHVRERVEEQP